MSLTFKLAAAAIALPIGLFALANRSVGELVGLTRAGADVVVDGAMGGVPTVVVDGRLDNDIQLQRRRLTDHEVDLNVARHELALLNDAVDELAQRAERRQRLLAEAYPVLQAAMAAESTEVEFAGATHTLADFQADIDQLLAEGEREQRQLETRRTGLKKLTDSVETGERALMELRDSLLAFEQEIDLLRARREQARLEGQTLDLVSAVTAAAGPATTEVGAQAARLRKEVGALEAGNEARRAGIPVASTPNRVAADWERLERLKAISLPEDKADVSVAQQD
jgi:DNA repair exonuclease SbcCD ATPase subunit